MDYLACIELVCMGFGEFLEKKVAVFWVISFFVKGVIFGLLLALIIFLLMGG